MSNTKHTRGPWKTLAPAPGYRGLWKVCAEDEPLLELSQGFNIEANAQLIAAGPELLEACKTLLDAIGMFGPKGGPLDTAREAAKYAIAKAEGNI